MNSNLNNIIVKNNSIAIIGFYEGSAGQIYEWIKNKYHVSCFVNYNEEIIQSNIKRNNKSFEYPKKNSYKGIPLITSKYYFDILKKLNIKKILITIEDPVLRYKAIKKAKKNNIKLISVIHPSAILLNNCKIKQNVIIHANVVIGYKAKIKSGSIINTSSIIEHHAILNNCVTIDPNVTIAGNVYIDKFTHIHTSVTIINKIQIGKNSIIGAGAVVIKDIKNNTLNVGIPSRIVKNIIKRV